MLQSAPSTSLTRPQPGKHSKYEEMRERDRYRYPRQGVPGKHIG